ncbi:MAG: rhodanese-like domain-containing protein [Myxococcales bacterium]
MTSRSPVFLLLIAFPFACATPAAHPPAAAVASDANPSAGDAALSRPDEPGPIRVDGATARRLVADGARLVDVRDAESYAQGHIAGAINIPVSDVAARAAEIGPGSASVVVYCRTGARSAKAAGILAAMGYQHVYDLGSYLNWGDGAPAPAPLPPAPGPKT